MKGRERTDLLPVLALVLRHGAAEDVVLIEGEGGREGQRYAEGNVKVIPSRSRLAS